ncbi:PAAR domain-containing protein [Xanthomonas oryzae]|uniref:PAAR domain-containing protein n=1 Tax=Xanthomonas oryzae TaxID=347 RepID=UPI00273D519A|nr:PAAR domain-containing protein [Xanthomonas oryzae]
MCWPVPNTQALMARQACEGHPAICPLHGRMHIEGASSHLNIHGRKAALDGDKLACGATLIAGRQGRLKFQVQHFSPLQTRVFCQNTGSRNFCTINGLLGCPSIRCANSRSLELLHLTLETAL